MALIVPGVAIFLKTDVIAPLLTTMSSLLSPSRSDKPTPAENSDTFGDASVKIAKEPAASVPEVEVLRKIWTEPVDEEVTISGFPSPSMSPTATLAIPLVVPKSTRVAKLPALIIPNVLVFLNTDMLAPVVFAVTKSGSRSPSRSLKVTPIG